MSETMLRVEVAYAGRDAQVLLTVQGPPGMTVEEAIDRSGVLARFSEIDLAVNKVGIYGKLTKLAQPLVDADRVEIYRPLIADPNEQRKKRAAAGKVMRKGAGEEAGA